VVLHATLHLYMGLGSMKFSGGFGVLWTLSTISVLDLELNILPPTKNRKQLLGCLDKNPGWVSYAVQEPLMVYLFGHINPPRNAVKKLGVPTGSSTVDVSESMD